MKRGIPSNTSDLIPWLSNAINPKADPVTIDKNYTYYLDYQFNKKMGQRYTDHSRSHL